MSLYYVQKLFFHLLVDPKVKLRFQTDLEATLSDYQLTPEELAAIKSFDLAALYRMGAHPLLLRPFSGLKGMGMPEYLKAISGLAEEKKR
jgi:hypothetical protein